MINTLFDTFAANGVWIAEKVQALTPGPLIGPGAWVFNSLGLTTLTLENWIPAFVLSVIVWALAFRICVLPVLQLFGFAKPLPPDMRRVLTARRIAGIAARVYVLALTGFLVAVRIFLI